MAQTSNAALLAEIVDFTGSILFLENKPPAFLIGAIRNGETATFGYGEIADGSKKAPDGDAMMRIGSITKVFCGTTLASMVADGLVRFTDRLEDRLDWGVPIPQKDGTVIRLIDLVTHSSGLPREIDAPPDARGARIPTKEQYVASLKPDVLLFPPGTGALYSNFGFDMLAAALACAGGKPYPELLAERVLKPAGLKDTMFKLRAGDQDRAMQGHNFDGSPLPFIETSPMIVGAGGLYSTANDMLRWLSWHLDRFAATDAEMRLLDHAAYRQRDGLNPVAALDEAGEMDAMGLGWVIMQPKGKRPLILQKAGGLQGVFSYVAFAPSRGVGVFVAMNEFNLSGGQAMMTVANDLIAELAPH